MSSPIILVGLIAAMAVAFVLVGLRRKNANSSADEVMERMGRFATREDFLTVSEGSGRHEANRVAQSVEEMFKGRRVADKSASLLTRADLRMTVGEFILIRLLAGAGGFALGFIVLARFVPAFGILSGIVTGFIAFGAPSVYLGMKAKRRTKKFVDQLGDTITLMANSLRAGFSLLQTMEMVSPETKDPIGVEFRRVVREVGLGVSQEEAMGNLLRRVPSEDLDLLITAINIQHEVGGNLAQILTTIGVTIRERVRIKGEIGVLTAQVQMSGYIISLLPVVMVGVIFLVNPSYMMALFAWPWICMPIASIFMITAGFFIMKKIATIEV